MCINIFYYLHVKWSIEIILTSFFNAKIINKLLWQFHTSDVFVFFRYLQIKNSKFKFIVKYIITKEVFTKSCVKKNSALFSCTPPLPRKISKKEKVYQIWYTFLNLHELIFFKYCKILHQFLKLDFDRFEVLYWA